MSDQFREQLRSIEDHLEHQRELFNEQGIALSKITFVGLWIALAGVVILGWTSSRMLARSLTNPLTRLHSATAKIGTEVDTAAITALLSSGHASKDELGTLEAAFLHMAEQIGEHVHELEVLNTIGHEINTIGPDGLEGVLRRITDRAAELVEADACIVFLRDERMGCWVVEAASGEWNDRLKKSVMLWEELPVCVEAFETRSAATGNHFHSDERPQVLRRNLLGESMLAIPLLSQGTPFGVLSLSSQTARPAQEWNQRLAKGLTQEAALAISNARLYEAVLQKQKRLLARLRQLEHLAETLAHDLKGPGARMEELAKLLAQKFSGQVDERTAKWLKLLQENGKDIVERVEGILEVARVGTGQGAVTAVDPRVILDEVLKSYAGEIERLGATVEVEPGFLNGELIRYRTSVIRAIEADTKEDFQRIVASLPQKHTRLNRAMERFVEATNASRGGRTDARELTEFKAVRESIEAYLTSSHQVLAMMERRWNLASGAEAQRLQHLARQYVAKDTGAKFTNVTIELDRLLEVVAAIAGEERGRCFSTGCYDGDDCGKLGVGIARAHHSTENRVASRTSLGHPSL